jgi:hypothetical protein
MLTFLPKDNLHVRSIASFYWKQTGADFTTTYKKTNLKRKIMYNEVVKELLCKRMTGKLVVRSTFLHSFKDTDELTVTLRQNNN